MHEEQEGVIPGNALVVDPKKQFRPLSKFGNAFLNRFQCSNTTSEVLKGNYEFHRLLNYHYNSYLYYGSTAKSGILYIHLFLKQVYQSSTRREYLVEKSKGLIEVMTLLEC